jgi:SAM-dependent methyltransferase
LRDWDSEYRSGRWDGLSEPRQIGHHSIVAGLIQYFDKGRSVLDVGCGVGELRPYLSCREYLGLDTSLVAIQRARDRHPDTFWVGDIFGFIPQRKFSCVVFNESLYYMDETAALARARDWLRPGGIVVVSMWSRGPLVYDGWASLAEFTVHNDKDYWTVGAMV